MTAGLATITDASTQTTTPTPARRRPDRSPGPRSPAPRSPGPRPPGPLRIVVRPAPRREPPFDDELGPEALAAVPTPYDQCLPFALSAPAQHPWAPVVRRSALPDPGVWSRRLLIGLTEAAAGHRPLPQLGALLSPSVARGIGADFKRSAAGRRPHWLRRASVRTVRACEPAEGVAEVSATLETGERVRAVALRLEAQHGRWRCTRLQLG